jgi:hypothetical protein
VEESGRIAPECVVQRDVKARGEGWIPNEPWGLHKQTGNSKRVQERSCVGNTEIRFYIYIHPKNCSNNLKYIEFFSQGSWEKLLNQSGRNKS